MSGGVGSTGTDTVVGGMTTPRVKIIFIAPSTLMSSSIACERGTMTMKPEVGFGVVGMNTYTNGSSPWARDSLISEAVWNPTLHMPARGYSISSTFLNELPELDSIVVEKL